MSTPFSPAIASPAGRYLTSLLFLIGAGIELSRVARDTFFLQTVGSTKIPVAYIIFACIMVGASLAYSRASRWFGLTRLASITLFLAAAALGAEAVAISCDVHSPFLAFALFSTVELAFLFVPMTVWAIANSAFTAEEGEIVLPSIAACGLLGAATGGLGARIGTHFVGPYNLLYIAVACFAAALFIARRPGAGAQSAVTPPPRVARHGETPWSQPLVRTLVTLAFPMWLLAYMIEYSYFAALDHALPSEQDLSEFLALFTTVCSLLALLVQVSITPRLVAWRGPAATCFLYPVALAIAAVCTLTYALIPSTANNLEGLGLPILLILFARFLDLGLFQSLYESTAHILYFAVPEDARVRARALVSGIVFPLSIACAGLVLVWFKYSHEPAYHVAFCAVVVGFLVLVMAMDIRPEYLRALITHTAHDHSARAALFDEISKLSVSESRQVLLQSLTVANGEEAALAAQLLAKDYDHSLLDDLMELRRSLNPDALRTLSSLLPESARNELVRAH